MNIKNYFKMTIKSNTKNENFVRTTVGAFCCDLNPTIEQINDIKTAVSEAFTNCIVHAYNSVDNNVDIETTILEDRAKIKIIDYGAGIGDVQKALEPFYTTKPDQERSGMGFTIMNAFMDKVEVISEVGKGTTVIMTKILPQNADA